MLVYRVDCFYHTPGRDDARVIKHRVWLSFLRPTIAD